MLLSLYVCIDILVCELKHISNYIMLTDAGRECKRNDPNLDSCIVDVLNGFSSSVKKGKTNLICQYKIQEFIDY